MTLDDAARNAAVNAVTALLDSGVLVFEDSTDTEVATCTFGSTAFDPAGSGSAEAAAITNDSDATGGTVDHCMLRSSPAPLGTADIMELTCGLTGTDLTLTSLTITTGDIVSVTSLTLAQPAS
jgi:hypothetical protein